MPIYSIGKKRESLNLTAESYKDIIRKYLETNGYSQLTDSRVEGHLGDMIFINPDYIGQEFWVESKATSILPNEKKFCNELFQYFIEWLNLPIGRRFVFYVFAKKLNNKIEFDRIFGDKYSIKNLESWIKKHKRGLSHEQKSQIKNASLKDFVAFFSQIKLFEADVEGLTNAIKDKTTSSALSLKRYAERLLQECKRREKPIKKRNILISNLVVVEVPSTYYVAETKYKKNTSLYAHFNKKKIEIPPISFYPQKQQISTFVPINQENPLHTIIKGDVKPIDVNKTNPQFLVSLINQHIKRIFWKKGLRRVSGQNLYYFETNKNKEGIYNEVKVPLRNGKLKIVVFPYYKDGKKEKENFNFILHHAADITVKKYWDNFYIQIIPKLIYTLDGVTPVEGDVKDAIDRRFRTPIYNRSPNKLSELRFWLYHLFESNNFAKEPEEWFKMFKFKGFQKLEFGYWPKTIEKNQTCIGEYENGAECTNS